MTELILLIISRLCDKLLRKVFFWHGSWVTWKRFGIVGLKKYWKAIAISNDMNLNVVGQHLLNQRLSKNEVFGDPLMTVSAAKHRALLEPAGKKWKKRIDRLEAEHFAKSYELYKTQITKAYNEL